jgi:hypothetical protein
MGCCAVEQVEMVEARFMALQWLIQSGDGRGRSAEAVLRLLRRCYGRRNTRNQLRHGRSALPCYVVTPIVKEI